MVWIRAGSRGRYGTLPLPWGFSHNIFRDPSFPTFVWFKCKVHGARASAYAASNTDTQHTYGTPVATPGLAHSIFSLVIIS